MGNTLYSIGAILLFTPIGCLLIALFFTIPNRIELSKLRKYKKVSENYCSCCMSNIIKIDKPWMEEVCEIEDKHICPRCQTTI